MQQAMPCPCSRCRWRGGSSIVPAARPTVNAHTPGLFIRGGLQLLITTRFHYSCCLDMLSCITAAGAVSDNVALVLLWLLQALVRNEMATTYGEDKVAAVNVVHDTRKLDPLLAKYNKTKGQLEDITDDYIGKLRRNADIKRKQVGSGLMPVGRHSGTC